LPEYKPNYTNLEFRIIKSEFNPNVRNSIQSKFPKTMSTVYLVKLADWRSLHVSQSTMYCISYYFLRQLRIRNFSNKARKRCVLKAYW